jgi:hypothetical protein
LATNTFSFNRPASLLLLDETGQVLRRRQIDARIGYAQMVATYDALFILGSWLFVFNHDGLLTHSLDFMEGQYYVNPSALGKDSTDQLWIGVVGGRDSIESRIFRISAEGEIGAAYVLRPRFTYGMPEHGGWIQDMAALPDGGWVIAVHIAYFDPDNPWEQRWKYLAYLAEMGADGTVRWAQLYRDMQIIGIERDGGGCIWAYGYLERTSNILEKAVVIRFSSQGEPEWALERMEGIYDWVLPDTLAVTPGGGLAMGWTEAGHQELWFGVVAPSRYQAGCDKFTAAEIADRWMGPVEIEVRPAAIEAVEQAPVEVWEEPIELWEGTGDVTNYCPLGVEPLKAP